MHPHFKRRENGFRRVYDSSDSYRDCHHLVTVETGNSVKHELISFLKAVVSEHLITKLPTVTVASFACDQDFPVALFNKLLPRVDLLEECIVIRGQRRCTAQCH